MVVKDVKTLVVYDVECRMTLEPMQGNQASSTVVWGTQRYFTVLP